MCFLDEGSFGFIDAGVLTGMVADIPPGKDTRDHGANARDDEGHAPGVEMGQQAGDDQRTQGGTQRCATVQQCGAAAAFVLGHPDAVELAACRVDGGLGSAQTQTGDQQRHPAGASCGDGLEEAPTQGGADDDHAWAETVGQHAAGNLHEGIGPEEGTHQQALNSRAEIELLGDHGHGHGQRCAVNVIDRDQEKHHQEDLPAHLGRRCRRLWRGKCGWVLHLGSRSIGWLIVRCEVEI